MNQKDFELNWFTEQRLIFSPQNPFIAFDVDQMPAGEGRQFGRQQTNRLAIFLHHILHFDFLKRNQSIDFIELMI